MTAGLCLQETSTISAVVRSSIKLVICSGYGLCALDLLWLTLILRPLSLVPASSKPYSWIPKLTGCRTPRVPNTVSALRHGDAPARHVLAEVAWSKTEVWMLKIIDTSASPDTMLARVQPMVSGIDSHPHWIPKDCPSFRQTLALGGNNCFLSSSRDFPAPYG